MATIIERPDRPLPWFVVWREPETKKQRARAFRLKREAQEWRDKVSTDLRRGTYVDPRPVPFKEWAEGWLARTKPTVSPNAAIVHEWAVTRYVIPAFGRMALQGVTAERIERWQADLLGARKDDGGPRVSPRSVQICRTILGAILKDARLKGRLYANPMEAVRRIDVPKREMAYLTVDQLKAVCEQAGRVYGILFLLLALCGLRIAEALALGWADVDLERCRLWVRRQVLWHRRKDIQGEGPRWTFGEPKSEAGKRVVELPAPLVPFLAAHREAQDGTANPHRLLFPSEEGGPLDPRNVRRRHFKPALKALGITGVRMHDARRTFIALHVEAGTHPKLVQARVGHSDVRLTMDVYGKLAGEMALPESAAAHLDALAAQALPAVNQ